MSYQSKYTGEEIDNKLDKIGELGVLDSVYCQLPNISPSSAGQMIPLQYKSGNMKVQDGKVVIKPGQRVQVNFTVSYSGTSSTANIEYAIKDFTNNKTIQHISPYRGDSKYEMGYSITAQYTNETDADCEIGIVVIIIYTTDTIRGDMSSVTVFEIGRAMVIDKELPVATENTLGGIKVGEGLEVTEDGILSALATKGNVTLLAEPNDLISFTKGPSGQDINKEYTLNDSLENYDLLLVEWGTDMVATINPIVCSTQTIIDSQYSRKFVQLSGNANDFTRTIEIHLVFTSANKLYFEYVRSQFKSTVTIQRVYGIKLGTNTRSNYKEVELLEQPLSFKLGRHGHAEGDVPGLYNLKDSIYNYNQLHIIAELEPDPVVSAQSGYYQRSTHVENVNSIIFNNADVSSSNGSRMFINIVDSTTANHTLCYWFKDDKTFRTIFCKSSDDIGTYSHMRIASIKGIKY